jgi:hypothetical protein
VRGAGFFLGTHQPGWLERLDVPLMVSHRTLHGRRRLPRAPSRWALDSGAFTQLRDHGRWTIPPVAYAEAVARYAAEVGQLAWAAPQDWMCEPAVIAGGTVGGQRFVGTGLDVATHQRRTIASFLQLRELAPHLPWIPVVQGWTLADYDRCLCWYAQASVDLAAVPLVGLGSVCRRQATAEIGAIVGELARAGLRLHGFGVKRQGLARYADQLESADSLAWSARARRGRIRLPGCRHPRGAATCANCLRYALAWRERLVRDLDGPRQLRLGVLP